MAVIASNQITLSRQPDIDQTIHYYKKQSSTSAAPAKPTSYPPTGWTTTEPSYSSGDTDTLYTTVCTLYSDGTFDYADVSVSSSYEAAKAAYNKAVSAENVASSKNAVFYQESAPATTGRKVNDIWFDSDDGNAMYKFDGTNWVLQQFGTNALVASSVTAAKINTSDLYTNFLLTNFLSAAQAKVSSLSAITANIGTITAGILKSSDYSYSSGTYTTAGMIIDLNNKVIRSKYAAILGDGKLYASAGTIGPWTIGATGIYNGKTQYGDGVNGTYIGTNGIEIESNYGWIEGDPSAGIKIYSKSRNYVFGLDVADDYASATIYPGGYQCITEDLQTAAEMGMNSDTYGFIGLTDTRQGHNRSIELDSGDPGIFLQVDSDTGILKTAYSSGTVYNLIRNHNNGNISISASSGTLCLGYENTTSVQSNCLIYAATAVLATAASGEAYIQARNSGTGNRIYMWSNSNGYVGISSYGGNNTSYQILRRDINSNAVTAHGSWTFDSGMTCFNTAAGTSKPIISSSSSGTQVGVLAAGSSGLAINGQWGGTSFSSRTLSVPASDIRLKEHIEDSTVEALPLINSIRMREFDWKDGRHQSIGFIADELEELDRGLSIGGGWSENEEMNVKSVDTFYLLGYAIKAIQELSAEINRLKGAA